MFGSVVSTTFARSVGSGRFPSRPARVRWGLPCGALCSLRPWALCSDRDVSDTCEGTRTRTVDADGVVTCRQATDMNHVSLSVDAEVVGSDIVAAGSSLSNGDD